MEPKEYLMSVREAAHRLPRLRQMRKDAWDQATSAVACPGDGPVASSNISNIPEAYAIQIDRIDRDIEAAEKLIAEASSTISKIMDPMSQDLLYFYYLGKDRRTWKDVGLIIGLTGDYVCKDLQPAALEEFAKVWENPRQSP